MTLAINPAAAGFFEQRLAALQARIQADIDARHIPGAVMQITRNGSIACQAALGRQDPAQGTPMTLDSIFRIYSMTKPIVSIGVMMLVEQGRLLITDPVSKFFPTFKDLKVGIEKLGADGLPTLELVPAKREMTVQDLLRHTSGLTYGMFGESLVKSEYIKHGIESSRLTNAELVQRLTGMPLMYHPGTTWEYSRATDVLGALLEHLSDTTLDVFLQERILHPLGMVDTGFWVEPDQQHRLAEPFALDPDSGKPVRLINVRTRPSFLSGGGGLTSTLHDYARFARMLLNEGELDGVRLVSRKTLQFMASDHLVHMSNGTKGLSYLPGPGYGFGLGFSVRTAQGAAPTPGSVGDYNWSGLGGTYFWIDPRENMFAIWLMQAPEQRNQYRQLFRNLVYSALV